MGGGWAEKVLMSVRLVMAGAGAELERSGSSDMSIRSMVTEIMDYWTITPSSEACITWVILVSDNLNSL